MSMSEPLLLQIVNQHIPAGATVITIDKPVQHPAVYAADLTGDGMPEITAVYQLHSELYLLILKFVQGHWIKMALTKGLGYGVTLLTAAPVTSTARNNLIVGWQIGAIWSKLAVYEWTESGLTDIVPDDLYYSYAEILDMPGTHGRDGKVEIALWIHDTGEAYRVEIIRWQQGQWVQATDVYHSYFPKVVQYYEQLTAQYPDYVFYWYYLADAQFHAGLYPAALTSVQQALSLPEAYPSREELLKLEKQIKQAMTASNRAQAAAWLYPISVRTTNGIRWGYMDAQGHVRLEPVLQEAQAFQPNGLAVVVKDGRAGVINLQGQYVVQPVYDSIHSFSEERAIAMDSQGFKMINEQGVVLTSRAYPFIADVQDGRAVFYDTSTDQTTGTSILYGYLDTSGKEVIRAQYMSANDFQNGKAVVQIKDKEYALIDVNGNRISSYPYAYVGPLGDGLLAFQKELSGKYGYIDERGNIRIQPRFTTALPFNGGQAIVNTAEDYRSNYGVINKQGAFVIQPAYNDIRELGEQRYGLGNAIDSEQPYIGSLYAIADMNGRRLTEFIYRNVENYKHGLASASNGTQTYLLDLSGRPAPGYPHIEGSGSLEVVAPDLISVFVDQRLFYVNRAGQLIWQQNTIVPLEPPYRVREEKYKPNRDYLVYYPQVEGLTSQVQQDVLNTKLKELSQVKPILANQQLDYTYTGDFDITFYQQQLLQLQLTGYNYPAGAAHGMPTMMYAIINLSDGQLYELKDLFKPDSDYVKVLSQIVGEQIKNDPQYSYVFPDTYTGISASQPFFVTADALHLYFNPYDIAPYAAGFPTFTIPFSQIMDIINTEGTFWKAFHM
ncbi:WG repeat-containing protein [Paenibacillus barcinonensis]|uniref:WG repeat protein n=1 Tax=Paenibacillus barcinonensis TaxID=198119 RepID=A0A2V4VIW6_PAEBA|nr:WG repeat-containing protein [Paenibacillus barcinonensis]PYE49074.1 WG repeat protein [Paenibacillus barcinonensis]QKS55321.1 WG repeat-containing protein [Paenibacillus barcinonensis]